LYRVQKAIVSCVTYTEGMIAFDVKQPGKEGHDVLRFNYNQDEENIFFSIDSTTHLSAFVNHVS